MDGCRDGRSGGEAETYDCYLELKAVAATKNVLLPVGSDYTPPNKWVTEIARDWNSRYVSPHFVVTTPRSSSLRCATRRLEGIHLRTQTRDMNPLYTGKDVSFIDTKQANRLAENVLLDAEAFATIASLDGARYPTEAIDKAWRQLLFNAHHDGITGSESDQVYLDLLGGWREAWELGRGVLDAALAHIGGRIETNGEGRALAVFNPTASRPHRSGPSSGRAADEGVAPGSSLRDGRGRGRIFWSSRLAAATTDQSIRVTITFLASEVPSLGYRRYGLLPSGRALDERAGCPKDGTSTESDRYLIEADPERGGGMVRLFDKRAGK